VGYVAGSELAPGATVAGYRIEALIGRGGMGAVYRAEEAGLGRKVALKVIAPELAQDERFRERFLRESQIAASLDHPHVIPIYQAGEDGGVLYLAMRYVEGADLAKLVAQEGALEPRRALELLSQVAEALDAAHEKGLVHRDVKPSNVLIAGAAGREHCYLADFGLTKRTGSLSAVTAAGDIVGTLEYVAPEQITGDPLDERADVYSLGCVLYECLTGSSPFPRATDVALLWAHVHEEPTPLSKARSELPKELDSVLARALAKEPGRRYRSAGELAAAARSALGLAETAPAKHVSRWLLAGIAAVVLVGIAVPLALMLQSESGGLSAVSANAVGVIDPDTNELVAEVLVGARPGPLAVGEGAVWVANLDDETISRIDPETRQTVRTIPAGGFPAEVAVGRGSVWVFLPQSQAFRRITPEFSETELLKLKVDDPFLYTVCGTQQVSLAIGGGRAWIACNLTLLMRVDLRTGFVAQPSFDTGGLFVQLEFSDIAFGLGSAWMLNRATNTVTEIDPETNQALVPKAVTVGKAPIAIAVGPDSLWVANHEDDTVTRVEMLGPGQAPALTTIPVGDGPVDVAVGEGAVWVANSFDGTVSRIDPETNEVVATIEVGERPQRIAAGEGAVWVTLRGLE